MVKVATFLRLFHKVHLAAPPVFGDFGLDLWSSSGVVTGWHGWTMSRGPGAKGAPKERQLNKNKMKNGKGIKKEEKKRENKTFQVPGRGPSSDISP